MDRDLAAELATPKYAHRELERRWLVEGASRPDLGDHEPVLIEDRYLDGSRFRLRRMTRPDWTACKLTKKYETVDASARPIVTAYLSETEFALFHALSGHDIVKRRYHITRDGQVWSLDVFEGGLAGLELIESEASDQRSLANLVPPPWAGREVTYEPCWQGGALAVHGPPMEE